jgi:hypothetical protein
MGTSVISVRVTGNHGCQREVKNGGTTAPTCGVKGCDPSKCVDAVAREMVEKLRATGSVDEATLVHWPHGPGIVIDDLKTGKRTGSF